MRNAAGKVMWGTTKVAIAAVVALSATLALMLALPSVASAAPANDAFGNAQTISMAPASVNGNNIGATEQSGEPEPTVAETHSSVWYSWTAPDNGQVTIDTCTSGFDTVLSVHTGSTLSGLTEVASDDQACWFEGPNISGSKVIFDVTKDTTYRIRVASRVGDGQGNFTLNLQPPAPPPPPPSNDNFASAETINGASASVNGTNVEATEEAGEPEPSVVDTHSSVWYSWTASQDGQAMIDTCTSGFDTVLSVHTGSTLSGLAEVASDDEGCWFEGPNTSGSLLVFNVTAGTTYRIRVASWFGHPPQGTFTLNLQQMATPANDNFADAETISGDNVSINGTNMAATEEAGETGTSFSDSRSVWYSWTAPFSGQVTIDTCTSDFYPVLSVHTGDAVSNLARLAEDRESCTIAEGNDYGNKLTFVATKDTVYYIRVASLSTYEFIMGNFTLDLVLTDNVAPETTIIAAPNGLTNDDTPTFSFSGSDNKSASESLLFSYRVDGGGWSDYAAETSATLSSLSDGPHTFYVKAKDEAGNEGSPVEQSFTVELRSPRVETVSPTGPNASRTDNIVAIFSEPMKPSTITTTTIKMKVGKKRVPVAVSLSGDGKTATIDPYPADPSRALAPNKRYKVTITTGAQDLSGKALDQNPALSRNQPMVWTFTTEST